MRRLAEYAVWKMMRQRCENPNLPAFSDYGGRGITVCDRWKGRDGFANFVADMGRRPSPKHTIDRIDVDGPYAPWNCRWATRLQQAANKRNNVFVLYDGERMVLSEAARRAGLKPATVWQRRKSGSPDSELFVHLKRRPRQAT